MVADAMPQASRRASKRILNHEGMVESAMYMTVPHLQSVTLFNFVKTTVGKSIRVFSLKLPEYLASEPM